MREQKSKIILEKLYQDFSEANATKIAKAAITTIKEPKARKVSENAEESKVVEEQLTQELESLKKDHEEHQEKAPGTSTLDHKTMTNTRFDLNDSFSFENFDNTSIQLYKDEEEKEYEEDENEFTEDVIFFKGKTYDWSGKYRPRKPRFFNRVKTGFEWNAYNKAHYDLETPPPKIVQGYKFNIFYPDLINKQETPQYNLEKCEDPSKLRIIFKSGPPYEEIAFEIVNKEWELRERHGFKCVFDRGILHLYFNFKRPKG